MQLKLGWYLYDQQTGFDYGMIAGTFSVILAAWLMYEKNGERGGRGLIYGKNNFFWFSNSNFAFVIYLGGSAIMKGFKC